jgi:ABC-2 type transport system ATP-binding protein
MQLAETARKETAMVLMETRPAQARTDQAVVALRGLRVRYAEIEAVRGVDLEIRRNETFGLLGPNGAGKTTILSCIEGLRQPDEARSRSSGET